MPDEVRTDKWRVLARRLMASGGEDLQEFLHNVVRAVAGDAFYIGRSPGRAGEGRRSLGEELEEFLKRVNEMQDKELQRKLIAYIKARAIPLVIRLSAQVSEREGG